ncbi:uncharacterized protein FIBRA_04991 [Fibroporia radiculosa]|uniref:Uncharacterized protein n=1 Tax=Fibroporia radiculosa TaxID=599839 RepID=J4HWU6_9APHY|nr:uncharacterized protein FIBRA_04991 [Fibroporia radiculosa]CCM02877.1 predicted protein [Fibroporia radiculosa]
MCVGENCAPQAVHYVNAQLTALYENALDCVKTHDNADKPGEHFKYSHALADFSFVDPYIKGHHTMFQANFGKPRLEFICNHDAVLHLTITKGYYRLDYNRSSTMAYAEKDRLQILSDVEVAFRVGFSTRELRGKDSSIGNGQNLIQLIVLDLLKAQMISAKPAIIIGRDAFVHFMSQYLNFLHQAGNHVLFSLPDFDDDRYRLTIDYSLMGSPTLDVQEIHGINVEKINTYLSSVWLKCAMALDSPEDVTVDWKSTILAEYRSTWSLHADSGFHFHVRLGAPRVQPVCSRETILYFTIDEILFFESDDLSVETQYRYGGWEIAILVDIVHEKNSDGHVTSCKLDLTTARPYHRFCSFPNIDSSNELELSYCTRILEFFTSSYLDVLESIDFHVIYHFDARWQNWHLSIENGDSIDEGLDEATEDWTITSQSTNTKVTAWVERMTRCNMFGFDQVSAISQSSINAFFASLWAIGSSTKVVERSAALTHWHYEKFFSASFKPLTVRLLSNGRAIVWVHMNHGHIKTLKNWKPWSESENYSFEGWHLAFEVELKKYAHAELDVSKSWLAKYAETAVFKEHGDCQDRHLVHLVLDFKHAQFLHEFSTFEGLFQMDDRRPIDKVQAAVHYLKSHYLPYLAHWGLHIIHTVPIWTFGSTLPSCALTSVAFHVYSKLTITRQNWAHVSTAQEPVIAILGMSSFRPLPSTQLEYSADWVVRATKGISYGTVCVSRAAFMEQRLLHLLARVNALTTVVPKFSGIHNGVWKLELTTWAKHEWKSSEDCKWVAVPAEHDGFSKYAWQHRDCWKYEHEGSGDVANGTYAVSCLTRNYVELPRGSRTKSLDIKVWGEVEVEMTFASALQRGSAKSSSTWNTSLCLQNDTDGLKLRVIGSPNPVIKKTTYTGDRASEMFTDLETSLRAQLPGTIDFREVRQELQAFEGVWKYGYAGMQTYCLSNPVFTALGDIMFELRPHIQQVVGTASSAQRQVSSASLRGPSASIRSRSSFFGKVKEVVNSALSDGHVNGDKGDAHKEAPVNGNGTHGGKVYAANAMTLPVGDAKGGGTGELEVDELSFRVSEVVVA